MTQPAKVQLVHAQTQRRYAGVREGGWTTVVVSRRVGDWQPINTNGQDTILTCHVYGCQAQTVFHLNDVNVRAQFARNVRLRRAKRLGMSLATWLTGVLIQLYSPLHQPLLVTGIVLTSIGSLISVALLLLLIFFGGRMPHYKVLTSTEPPDTRHEVKIS